MRELTWHAESQADTERLGETLAHALSPGTTVALCGPLGAGKTRLVQAIAVALGVNRGDITSPTFVLCNEYHGQRTLYHLDAYRIADDDEFLALGPEEFFESDGLTLVEWADRVMTCLPRDRLEIHIEIQGPAARVFTLRGRGDTALKSLADLARRL